jgi:hypothetical protein
MDLYPGKSSGYRIASDKPKIAVGFRPVALNLTPERAWPFEINAENSIFASYKSRS